MSVRRKIIIRNRTKRKITLRVRLFYTFGTKTEYIVRDLKKKSELVFHLKKSYKSMYIVYDDDINRCGVKFAIPDKKDQRHSVNLLKGGKMRFSNLTR